MYHYTSEVRFGGGVGVPIRGSDVYFPKYEKLRKNKAKKY